MAHPRPGTTQALAGLDRAAREVLPSSPPYPTDNAWAYTKTTWRTTCDELGISPRWTRPWRPQTNGKVERFHRTLAEEWAYHQPYTSETERQAAFTDWLDWYNYHRPHTGIGGQTPASRITNLSEQHT
jgi:transposase InsO family protein